MLISSSVSSPSAVSMAAVTPNRKARFGDFYVETNADQRKAMNDTFTKAPSYTQKPLASVDMEIFPAHQHRKGQSDLFAIKVRTNYDAQAKFALMNNPELNGKIGIVN